MKLSVPSARVDGPYRISLKVPEVPTRTRSPRGALGAWPRIPNAIHVRELLQREPGPRPSSLRLLHRQSHVSYRRSDQCRRLQSRGRSAHPIHPCNHDALQQRQRWPLPWAHGRQETGALHAPLPRQKPTKIPAAPVRMRCRAAVSVETPPTITGTSSS